jgi:uncharacterized Zn finger protein
MKDKKEMGKKAIQHMLEEGEWGDCPKCGSMVLVVDEWANIHQRECLVHCWDCDTIYRLTYKLDKIEEIAPIAEYKKSDFLKEKE